MTPTVTPTSSPMTKPLPGASSKRALTVTNSEASGMFVSGCTSSSSSSSTSSSSAMALKGSVAKAMQVPNNIATLEIFMVQESGVINVRPHNLRNRNKVKRLDQKNEATKQRQKPGDPYLCPNNGDCCGRRSSKQCLVTRLTLFDNFMYVIPSIVAVANTTPN